MFLNTFQLFGISFVASGSPRDQVTFYDAPSIIAAVFEHRYTAITEVGLRLSRHDHQVLMRLQDPTTGHEVCVEIDRTGRRTECRVRANGAVIFEAWHSGASTFELEIFHKHLD